MFFNFWFYLLLNLISLGFMVLFVLVGVAYLTLLERKILSYIQLRKGPNKVGVGGVFQPFSDAVKLIFKEFFFIFKSNYFIFYMGPFMSMVCMLILWLILPWLTNLCFMNYSILIMFVFMSLGGFMLTMMGWSSNSSYSLLGAIRFVAQSISYEVSFMLMVYGLMLLVEGYSLGNFYNWQLYFWNLFLMFPLFLSFFISALAELNRSPMDLVEGESELVSGFNIEYFGSGFILIFLSEYGMILLLSYVIVLLFTNLMFSYFGMMMGLGITLVLIIYMRGILPRIRYDELMYMCWKVILPLVLNYLLLIFGLKFFFVCKIMY